MSRLCDINVPETCNSTTIFILNHIQSLVWASRLFKTYLLIIEILFERNDIKTVIEIIEKVLEKFPNNQILISLIGKAKLKVLFF